MPSDAFLVQLAPVDAGNPWPGEVHNNLRPLTLRILKAGHRQPDACLAYVPAERKHPRSEELLRFTLFRSDKPTEPGVAMVELDGFLHQRTLGADDFDLKITGPVTFTPGAAAGFMTLRFKDAEDGGDWPAGAGLRVPLVGPPQSLVHLVPWLRPVGGSSNPDFAKVYHHPCLNMTHIISAMLAEGGLTLAVHVHSKNADDAGFPGFGRIFAEKFHSLALDRSRDQYGELLNASTPFERHTDISKACKEITDRVHQDFLHGQGPQPKIKRLAIFTHGHRRSINTGRDASNFVVLLEIGPDLDKFCGAIRSLLTPDALVSLLACNTGRGPDDAGFGQEPRKKGTTIIPLGGGSFAEALFNGLRDAAHPDVAIWAHTSTGHATRNQEMRAFTQWGVLDLIWLMVPKDQMPPPDDASRAKVTLAFAQFYSPAETNPKAEVLEQIAVLHPGAAVKARLLS